MIKVSGSLKLRGSYEVTLDMTEEQFDALSQREQNEVIEDAVDWRDWIDGTDLDDLDVDDLQEVE